MGGVIMTNRHPIEKTREKLILNADAFVHALYQGFKITRIGKEFRIGNNGSRKIDADTLNFFDFEECKGGDVFAQIGDKLGTDFKRSLEWAEVFTGKIPHEKTACHLITSRSKRDTFEYAERLYSEGRPSKGTLAEIYLEQERNLRWCNDYGLKFHPQVFLKREPSITYAPAMIAPAKNWKGDLVGVQVTYLTETGQKLNVKGIPSKKCFGRVGHGFFAAGKPTEKTIRIGVTEGVEDALSIKKIDCVPCLATFGTSNLIRLAIPSHIQFVTIYADNDIAGLNAASALQNRLIIQGIDCKIQLPPQGFKDFNEYLIASPESEEIDLFWECDNGHN